MKSLVSRRARCACPALVLFAMVAVGARAQEPPPIATSSSASAPSGQAEQAATPEPDQRELRLRILAAEDARADTPAAQAPIIEGLRSRDPETQRVAVRALGRLERPSLFGPIATMLSSVAPEVRIEAANALAQSVQHGDAGPAAERLRQRLETESHPLARGALAQALGRLPYTSADDVAAAEAAIVQVALGTTDAQGRPSPAAALGALKGLESLARLHNTLRPLAPAVVQRLVAFAAPASGSSSVAPAARTTSLADRFLRRLAFQVLLSGNVLDAPTARRALESFDEQMRRLAVLGLAKTAPDDTVPLERLLRAEPSAVVRFAALRVLARRPSPPACDVALNATADTDARVVLLATDLLATACPGDARAVARVTAWAAGSGPVAPGLPVTWHRRAHALGSLAVLAADAATKPLADAAAAQPWALRMYAARAAARVKAVDLLASLASDTHANVREAAIAGLHELRGHDADDAYLAALAQDDPQLLITAARSLEGTPRREPAAAALLDALDRVTALKRETSRDARKALLERAKELGAPALAPRLRPYLQDFDPVIAASAAEMLTAWTGQPAAAAPSPRPRAPLPTAGDLDELGAMRAVFTMRGGKTFDLKLQVNEAPLNAFRFARLARAHAFDGLTFHRVIPDFVIQGGSPGANEYAGDGPYSRDEVGLLSNLRGTVGVSTRGHDTGDGQFYVNLVDNIRLDHEYTVFGIVDRGMDVVDAILEADEIERVEIRAVERGPNR